MTNRDKAKKVIKNELEPLATELTEAVNEGSEKWLEKQLARIAKIKEVLMEVSKEKGQQDFFKDDFGGQF
jgi:hypothetical protein